MYNGTLNSVDDATGDFSFTITYDPKTKTATRTSDVVYTGTMVELKEQAVYTNKYEKIKELALTSEAVCGTVYDIWNIVGAEEVIGCLQYMMNIPEDFDTFWNNEVRY